MAEYTRQDERAANKAAYALGEEMQAVQRQYLRMSAAQRASAAGQELEQRGNQLMAEHRAAVENAKAIRAAMRESA